MATVSATRLASLKAWQLKYWALLTGVGLSGTKAELQASLVRSLDQLSLPSRPRKIVSVDMGIRNLAYCVVESSPKARTSVSGSLLKVTAWRRRDLLSSATAEPMLPAGDVIDVADATTAKQRKAKKILPNKDAFTPAVLSKTAFHVVQDLLAHNPDSLLIERQRFRSGGAAAIQEWTVRVNMLESMLWASLETLRSSGTSTSFPETFAIEPRRVAEFWIAGRNGMELRPSSDMLSLDSAAPILNPTSPGRAKVEKKDKMEIVKIWTSGKSDVKLEFHNEAAEIADAFRSEKVRGAREMAGGKLDDLADCLLQAVAYMRWDENKRAFQEMLKD